MSAQPQLSIVPKAGSWLALTVDQLLERTGWSRPKFFRKRKELIARTRADGGIEYLESSIPAKPAASLAIVPAPVQLGPLFQNVPSCPAPRILLPDPELQKQAEHRLNLIAPLLDFCAARDSGGAGRYAALSLADGRPVTSLERMVEYAAHQAGQSPRTIKRWMARYKSGGFAALADRIRADKGVGRWFHTHRDAAVLAAYLYLVERQSVTFVYEQLEHQIAEDVPSKETVRSFLSDAVSPAMKTLAREGQREYRERMSPYLRRGYSDVFANQILVGDHAIHDVEIQNDIFAEVPYGTPGRLRISAFVDYRSRKAWATWALEGSSRSIAATLVRCLLEAGPPEGIYVDNGKDYKKVARGATPASELPFDDDDKKAPANWWENEYAAIERTGLLARLGIWVTHCLPRHPQSKHVERFFRTMHERFDAAHATYTSGSPFTRPELTEKLMMRHRRLLKAGRVGESNHPTASRFILGCLKWIAEYNETPHSGEGMDGRSPNQVFAEERNPDQKPAPEQAALALLMAEYEKRQVRECAVTLMKYRYTPAPQDSLGWAAMHQANETEVLVAYNASDPEYVAALDLEGRFIAWLEAEPLLRFAPNDPATQGQIGQSMEMRRSLEKATRATLGMIATEARSNGARSAEELVYGRLLVPATAGEVVTQRRPLLAAPKAIAAPMTPDEVAHMILEEK